LTARPTNWPPEAAGVLAQPATVIIATAHSSHPLQRRAIVVPCLKSISV